MARPHRQQAVPRTHVQPGRSEEELERCLALVAYIITRHGSVYAPIFDRLEAELLKARAKSNPLDRARRYLEAHTIEGGVKAIR